MRSEPAQDLAYLTLHMPGHYIPIHVAGVPLGQLARELITLGHRLGEHIQSYAEQIADLRRAAQWNRLRTFLSDAEHAYVDYVALFAPRMKCAMLEKIAGFLNAFEELNTYTNNGPSNTFEEIRRRAVVHDSVRAFVGALEPDRQRRIELQPVTNWQVAVGLVCRARLFDVCKPAEGTQRTCIDRLFALMNEAFTGPVPRGG